MQTHLHTPNSLRANMYFLDRARLGAMLYEIEQMLLAIECNLSNATARHPVTQGWRNHYPALILFGVYAYREWQRRYLDGRRGGKLKHTSGERILERWAAIGCPVAVEWPAWYGDPRLTENHRRRLMAKAPEWYSRLGWGVEPVMENWYPTRDGGYGATPPG